MRTRTLATLPLLVTALHGCDLVDRIRERIQDNNGAQPAQPAQPQTVPTIAQQPAQPGQPTAQDPALIPPPQGTYDGNGTFTMGFLQAEARMVLAELVSNLEPGHQVRVQAIPLEFTANPAEVNAAAGCTRSGRSLMAVTGGMLLLVSASSEAKAADELAGTQVLTAYYDQTVQAVRREQAVQPIPPGSIAPNVALDPRKLARQRFLFDEQLGFILGHELAHHYRGHTGCAHGGNEQQGNEQQAEEAVRIASNTLPIFNQPVEVEADSWGIVNVLDTGSRRQGGRWTEEGSLLSMDFFQRLEGERGTSPLLLFVRTHPPSVIRRPIIQLWADNWRRGQRPSTAGAGGLPFPIPIPLPGTNTGTQQGGTQAPIQLPFPIPGFGGGQQQGGAQGQSNAPQLPFPIPLPAR